MDLYEVFLDKLTTSKITKKAISKNGLKEPKLITASIQDKTDLELLFEVESSVGDPHKLDLKGNEKESKRGYASVLRFIEMPKVLDEEDLSKENIKDVIEGCDVKVHCDCPAFYYQGMQQDNTVSGVARFKFQGQSGKHMWTLRHSKKGGLTGKALCKHLFACQQWVEKHQDEIVEKLLEAK